MKSILIFGALASLTHFCCSQASLAIPQDFWVHWSDGRAEVSTYKLERPRYGEPRVGLIHLIYVTEPFSKSKRVKVNDYRYDDPDHTIALKLNVVESWRTGVYEYRLMTSHFFDAHDNLKPLKSTFSSQEWCGVSFEESTWTEDQLVIDGKSYFEGESRLLHFNAHGRFTDQLLVIARGLQSGGPRSAIFPERLIESPKQRFLSHRAAVDYRAEMERKDPIRLETVVGSVDSVPIHYVLSDGRACAMSVEAAQPFRIMGWRCEGGERADLIETSRTAYWRSTRRVDEPKLSPTP